VLASRLVDYALGFLLDRFKNLRTRIVLACATDAFYEIYNDLVYGREKSYRAICSGLWPWEKKAISRYFPPPPGAVLVGAGGGGREPLALAQQGYQVVAFDPARQLAISLADVCGGLPVESLLGRYEDLPVLNSLSQPPASIDLRSRPPFAAAILGWGSISHLRSDRCCIEALRQFGTLTHGPILVSWVGRGFSGKKMSFNVYRGYCRGFTADEISQMAEDAGLAVVDCGDDGFWAVLRAAN
jgi:hypothetical protein